MPLKPGVVLDDRFEIRKLLGFGGFGEVYQARQLIFGQGFRDVALKLFSGDKVGKANAREVLADAVTLIGLQEENPRLELKGRDYEVSRHLVQVYDFGVLKTPESRAFMSMKLVRGKKGHETLQQAVWRANQTQGLPVALILKYVHQMLVPLAWMHTLDTPVVHGDLKPANVLMTESGDLVLTDFGMAARMPLKNFGGTHAYMASEKLYQKDASESSDVYAVGLMWYELLTGKHPFEGVDLEARAAGDRNLEILAHQKARKWRVESDSSRSQKAGGRIPPASELNPEMRDHPQLEAILNRCLEPMQSDRYRNAMRLLEHVDRYLHDGKLEPEDLSLILGGAAGGPANEDAPTFPDSDDPDKLLGDAEVLITSGRFQEAMDLVEPLVLEGAFQVPALLLKAEAQARLGREQEAEDNMARAEKLAVKPTYALCMGQAKIFHALGYKTIAKDFEARARKLR